MKNLKIRISSLALSFLVLLFAVPVFAATDKPKQQGITVSPAVITISVEPSDVDVTSSVEVSNSLNSAASVVAELKGVDDQNGVLAPSKELSSDQRDSISIDKSAFALQPGEKTTIQIMVRNTSKLTPGGTYVALVIRQVGAANNSVAFQSAIGAGIFITKQQGAVRKVSLTNFSISRLLFNEPKKVVLTFRNDGNVHVVPRGIVIVTNQKQDVLYKKGIVNQESFTTLPQKSVTLDVPLIGIKNANLPSKQKVTVQYRFDGSDEIKTFSKTIMYIPAYMYLLFAGAVLLVVFLIKNRNRKVSFPKQKTPPKTPQNGLQKKITIRDDTDGEKIPVRRS